jgi:hypothetical protein
MKFGFKMRITNIYISWFFEHFIAILTHREISWAYQPERQIVPLSPTQFTMVFTAFNQQFWEKFTWKMWHKLLVIFSVL